MEKWPVEIKIIDLHMWQLLSFWQVLKLLKLNMLKLNIWLLVYTLY